MQINSIVSHNCSGCGRKPQVAFGIGTSQDRKTLSKADLAHGFNTGISAGGPERENDTKDAFSRLDAQKPVKKSGIKNFFKRIFKK